MLLSIRQNTGAENLFPAGAALLELIPELKQDNVRLEDQGMNLEIRELLFQR